MNFDDQTHLPTKFLNFFLSFFFRGSLQRLTLLFPHWFIANGKRWSIIRSIDQNKFIKIEMEINWFNSSNNTKNTEIPKAEFMLSLRNEISLQRYHHRVYCWFCIFMCGIECVWVYRCDCGCWIACIDASISVLAINDEKLIQKTVTIWWEGDINIAENYCWRITIIRRMKKMDTRA